VKSPSKNITASLKGQRTVARAPENPEVTGLSKGQSMTVPGDGSVDSPPGMVRGADRSAARYAEPMSRVK
jgi:hypothetical protein